MPLCKMKRNSPRRLTAEIRLSENRHLVAYHYRGLAYRRHCPPRVVIRANTRLSSEVSRRSASFGFGTNCRAKLCVPSSYQRYILLLDLVNRFLRREYQQLNDTGATEAGERVLQISYVIRAEISDSLLRQKTNLNYSGLCLSRPTVGNAFHSYSPRACPLKSAWILSLKRTMRDHNHLGRPFININKTSIIEVNNNN